MLTAVSLGASSLTDRRAFASVAVIMVILGASIVVAVLADPHGVAWDSDIRVFDPLNLPIEVAARLFGDRNSDYREVDTWLVALGTAGWIVAGGAVVGWRYRKLGRCDEQPSRPTTTPVTPASVARHGPSHGRGQPVTSS